MVCKQISSPMVTGFIHPLLLLPEIVSTDEELTVIFKHELIHFRRNDLWYKLVLLLANAVHWFNPFVWLLGREAAKNLEFSCDEEVVAGEELSYRKEYSMAILHNMRCSDRKSLPFTTQFCAGKNMMKKRFLNILDNRIKKNGKVMLGGILALTVVCGLFISCQKTLDPSSEVEKLYSFRSESVGDASNFTRLADFLPIPTDVKRDSVELNTSELPYSASILYKMQTEKDADAVIQDPTFAQNAAVMFSLIKNLDQITCSLSHSSEPNTAVFSTYLVTRQQVEESIGNLWERSASLEEFRKLYEEVYSSGIFEVFETENSNLATTTATIDQLENILSRIVGDGGENLEQVKSAHSQDYETILKMGDSALNYLLRKFSADDAQGLRGEVMMSLCIDLLGNRNNVPTGSFISPQEWYRQLKPYHPSKLPKFDISELTLRERLVAKAVADQMAKEYYFPENAVIVSATEVLFSAELDGRLELLTTVRAGAYCLYGDTLIEEGGFEEPLKLVFEKNGTDYTLMSYEKPKDGSYYRQSLLELCGGNQELAEKAGQSESGLRQKLLNNVRSYVISNGITAEFIKIDGNQEEI